MSGIILHMVFSVASHQTHHYQIATPVYEGPLDLLLQLIERAELDITRLALSQITDQYLEHVRELKEIPAEELSAFLVIAARLLQIKSEALLPRPPSREPGEEDPGEALAKQLIVYRRFRQIADFLAQREEQGLRTYLRLASPPKGNSEVDLTGIGLTDLVAAARYIYAQTTQKPPLSALVALPLVTIREKIKHIALALRQDKKLLFTSLLAARRSRLDIVVTFLAMLELIKRQMITVNQETTFGDIFIETTIPWNDEEEFELEFGE